MSLNFTDFELSETTLKALKDLGYETPTPIQSLAIPEALKGFDMMAQAQTGTGKTAAFALPCITQLKPETEIQILVLTPTRELAQQVSGEFLKLGKYDNVRVATVVGGKSYRDQLTQLKTAKVLVATPGRLNDLLSAGRLKNFSPSKVVLDEADRMLDMGFADDLEQIFSYLPESRQTLLFSATYPREIQELAEKILKKNKKKLQVQSHSQTNENIEQNFFVVGREEKDEALFRLIDFYNPTKAIIFCEMKKDADRLGQALIKKGFSAMILHGDTEQNRREDIMRQYKKAPRALLVATDLAGRGLDVSDITHVINYQIPWGRDSYVHRIGRTGRAGLKGIAFSLVSPQEIRVINRWAKDTNSDLKPRELPTLKQVRDKNLESLSKELQATEVGADTWSFLTQLTEDMDVTALAGRLLQKYLEKVRMGGKDRLGLSFQEITRLSESGGRAGRSTGGGGRGHRGRRGGRSSGRSASGEGRREFRRDDRRDSFKGDQRRGEGGGSGRREERRDDRRSQGKSSSHKRSGGGKSRGFSQGNRSHY